MQRHAKSEINCNIALLYLQLITIHHQQQQQQEHPKQPTNKQTNKQIIQKSKQTSKVVN